MRQQTYNDGLVDVYAVKNVASPGDTPKEGLAFKLRLRFEERTVGISRYYQAMQQQVKPERVLRMQRHETVCAGDMVVFNGRRYRVERVQYIKDVTPPSMDLEIGRWEQYDGV